MNKMVAVLAFAALILGVSLLRGAMADDGVCTGEVEAANAEWRYKFPWGPSQKPGNNAVIEDRRGHRFSVVEYESMHRRLNAGRRLCRDGNLDGAHHQIQIVRQWLSPDNGPINR
jgi:hypothetical protein